jgi:superfamily II DNA/RNA helicase
MYQKYNSNSRQSASKNKSFSSPYKSSNRTSSNFNRSSSTKSSSNYYSNPAKSTSGGDYGQSFKKSSYSNSSQSYSNSKSRFGGPSRGGFRGGFRSGNSAFKPRRFRWSYSELIKIIEKSQVEQVQKSNILDKKADVEIITKHTFSDFNLNSQLAENIKNLGYELPTPIQDQAIPTIISGKDVIGLANTGTGKTASFLIPLINKHLNDKSQKVLIVTPTRELAEQINQEFMKFTKNMRIGTSLAIGGTSIFRQVKELKYKPNFIIGTPGRLKDLINRSILDVSNFQNVVLDEADQMLDIGFVEEIKFLIQKLSPTRQSLFFSATMNKKVEEIVESFVKDPIMISVKTADASENVAQDYIRIPEGKSKIDVLHNLLAQEKHHKFLIFGKTKIGVQKLAETLAKKGHLVEAIHGDKRQSQRKISLARFKSNEAQILIATDVVSRGIDIKDVTHVINFDLPESIDDYIHRIGRTGRAGKKGFAITLVD